MLKINENTFIRYNSLISLCITSQDFENVKYTKCLYAENNLENSLHFKLCKKPLREYYDLIGSYFYIRKVDECISNFGISDNNKKKSIKKEQKLTNEISFLSKDKIHQNCHFFLQHMVSKKFVSIEMEENNKFVIKLLKNIDNAANFSLRKINENRNSKEFLTIEDIFYLRLYIKEDDLFFYLQDDINPIYENNNNYYDILVDKNPITKFFITEQTFNLKDSKNLYSGQLINIIFSYIKGNKEEQFMICAEKKEQKLIDSSNVLSDDREENNNDGNKYNIVSIPYTNELCEHELHNSFWLIEENLENVSYSNKHPIKIKEKVRIKNLETGLYLSIRKKENFNNNKDSEIFDINSFILDNKNFEFILVDEYKLNNNMNLEYNFIFFNYMLDFLCTEIIDEGKYILKGVFTSLHLLSRINLDYYYHSISLILDNNNLMIKNEDDFIFKIKKIDMSKGHQVSYILNIIKILDREVKDFQINNYNIINETISFLLDYLLNIDYSFRDENYEYNVPIKERQIFLYKFDLVNICTSIIENYLNLIEDNNNFLTDNIKDELSALFSNIIKFFKFLSFNIEEIKISIYIIALNKLLKISEIIFSEDFTILISFIYDLIDDSEALQDYLLGGGGLLKQQISSNSKLSKYDDITNLLRQKKLLEYIEKNHNYLLCYEKLIRLNKVKYKRKEIIALVKNHIDEVKNKKNPCIKNYTMIINSLVAEAIILIKKHAILIERFKNTNNNKNDIIKKRRISNTKKNSIKDNINKKNQEEILKKRKSKLGTLLGNNIAFNDSFKFKLINKPFLEKRESDGNLNINIINSVNNQNNNNDNDGNNYKKIFSFSSVNSINTEVNTNFKNRNTLMTNETSESFRPLIEKNNIEILKSHFSNNKNIKQSIENRRSYKNLNNIVPKIMQKKTVKVQKIKTTVVQPLELKDTIRSEYIQPYQIYLNKLGKITVFIKLFIDFDLEKALFIQDNFLFEIFQNGLKTEDLENPLYAFFISRYNSNKNKNWFFEPKIVILYLFHLYNMMFPNLNSKIQTKINENQNISGIDIIDEIQNDNVDNNYSDIDDEGKYKQELRIDFETLDEYLCILYSIYQFCINQYIKTVYGLSKIIGNFYLNYAKKDDLEQFKTCFSETLIYLLSKITFMKNDFLENAYHMIIKNPSLSSMEYNIDSLIPILSSDKKGKKKNKKKVYSKSEILLIDYLMYFREKCEQIKYLYQKIMIFKYIKYLIDKESSFCTSKEQFDIISEDQLYHILQKLNEKKSKILFCYQKLNKIKEKYSFESNIDYSMEDANSEENIDIDENSTKDNYEIFKICKINEKITKLLINYDYDKFFNNIIYIESSGNLLMHDNIIRKIRKMREHLYLIEKEIQIIKANFGINSNDTFNSFNLNASNQKYFLNLNRHLSQICNEQGKLFNLNKLSFKRKDKLSQLLSMENYSFYKKIKFCKTFQCMIEAINYYKGEKDENIFIYCSYLLKIFNDIKNIGFNFHQAISKYYNLYSSLILESLECILEYPINNISENLQYLFLNICFFNIEGFLLIIKNIKFCFFEQKDFMENVFSKLLAIFEHFKTRKYKIIYQILYTYAVSRLLLFLNSHRNYDSYSYDVFYKLIYPKDKMRDNISFCVETINNNSHKENIINRKNTNIFPLNKKEEEDTKYMEKEENCTIFIPNDEIEPLISSNEKTQIMPMDLSKIMYMNYETKKTKETKEKTIIFKDEEEKLKERNMDHEFIRWDYEDEFIRLSFYLNFLSVYVIYLNEKNSLIVENEKGFLIKENNNEKEEVFSFNNLSDKIKSLLDYRYTKNISLDIKNDTNNLISFQTDISVIKEEKNFYGEDLGPKNKDYKFHSVLLESILNFRAKLRRKKIEIQVKKIKKDENFNEDFKTESQYLETSMRKNNNFNDNNSNNIIFYYYDPEYIDIILLEKIFNAIELKEDLMHYCIEDYFYEKSNPELLENLLDMKKNYEMIVGYEDEEFDLVHNYFIKNNMELLINKVLKIFTSNDLIEIEEMSNYLFNKMGEIYNDTNIKMSDECSEKNNSLVEFLKMKEENNFSDLSQIDLQVFFDSLVYIYPKFKKKICIIYYRIGFKVLGEKCMVELNNNYAYNNNSNSIDLESITKILLLLLSRKTNRELIEDKNVFPKMLISIRHLFSYIRKKGGRFLLKNTELLKELFNKLGFIFDHLINDFDKIVLFMQKPSNLKNGNKYNKKKNKLKDILDFLIAFLKCKKVTKENLLTKEINEFIGLLIEKVIKLIFILIKLPNQENNEIINILIDFLFNFIKGPEINNLNILFSLGFYDLILFVIKDLDYYKLFLNFLNKDNIYEVIDNASKIECKIIKIFIIYYNVSHGNNNIIEFEKLQHWYEDNFKYIRQKLKRLYYMSQKEMEKREYDINKMLLFMKSNDDYSENELKRRGWIYLSHNENKDNDENENITNNINDGNKNKSNKDNVGNKNNTNKFCIIKFDLLLAYYSLYNYHKDLTTKETESELCYSQKKNKSVLFWFINFFIDFYKFITNYIFFIFYVIYYIFKLIYSKKNKEDADLLQDLTNIDIESQLIDDQKMINFLRIHIRILEVSINNIIFRIFFPMIDKANIIEEYKEEYYKVEEIDSSEFIHHILSNYDTINIRAKQYVMIDRITNIPIINLIFKNIYIYGILLIILGLFTNLLIMLSFSTFVKEDCGPKNYPQAKIGVRIQCPYFLYKKSKNNYDYKIIKIFNILGIILLCLQGLIFIDYIVRIIFVEKALLEFKYQIKKLKYGNKNYNFNIIIKTIFRSILNFRSFYYILSLLFIIFGLRIHPFFYCITLLEFVNRIQLMQTVLKAMYKPLKNILITLLMFIILEYLFSLFAVSYYSSHFPNEIDTKNFLKIFMRMIDQTFKQDGGIGTYLDKTLDKKYVPYSAPAYFNSRFFFDLLFFLLILLLIFQMFLSTIIDYFNDTREKTQDFQEGLETQCIVCFMEREKVEKLNGNEKNAFAKHINYYHSAFNYVYYLMYLQTSSYKDSIIEKVIWKLHLKKDFTYLPKNACFKQFEEIFWKKLNQRKKKEEN